MDRMFSVLAPLWVVKPPMYTHRHTLTHTHTHHRHHHIQALQKGLWCQAALLPLGDFLSSVILFLGHIFLREVLRPELLGPKIHWPNSFSVANVSYPKDSCY